MKLQLKIGNLPITLEYSRTLEEQKLTVQKRFSKDQRKLLSKSNVKQAPGATYNNCNFGTPYPVGIPQRPQTQTQAVDNKVIEYAASQTGLPTEYVEKVLDAIDQYFEDRKK